MDESEISGPLHGQSRSWGNRTSGVTEIVPDRLYAVGWSVPADDRISWVPAESNRWLPLQCYALKAGSHAIILDTSVTAHRGYLQHGLDVLLEGVADRQLILTRYGFDTLCNLPWMTRRYGISRVYAARASMFDVAQHHITGFIETFEQAHTMAYVRDQTGIMPTPIPAGDDDLCIGPLRIVGVDTALRVQATSWAYESTTKSLFCADCWGFALTTAEGPPKVINDADDQINFDRIARYLRNKFDWLPGADTRPLANVLQSVLDRIDVERLCPTLGCVIEGKPAISRVMELTFEALATLRSEEYVPMIDSR